MKPNEVKLTLESQNRINSAGVSQNVVFLHQSPLILSPNQITATTTGEQLSSPATDALDLIPGMESHSSNVATESIDPQNLLIDLNELLRRDPTLSTLTSTLDTGGLTQPVNAQPHHAQMNAAAAHLIGSHHQGAFAAAAAAAQGSKGQISGMAIPGALARDFVKPETDSKPVLLKLDTNGQSGSVDGHRDGLFSGFGGGNGQMTVTGSIPVAIGGASAGADSAGIATTVSSSGGGIMDNGSSFGSISPLAWSAGVGPAMPSDGSQQLTLTQLNSPTDNDFNLGGPGGGGNGVKMEVVTNDLDDLDLFLTNSSPHVSFGLGDKSGFQAVKHEMMRPPPPPPPPSAASSHTAQPAYTSHTGIQLTNPNFWQASTDELLFGSSGNTTSSTEHYAASAVSAPASSQLSSSVGPHRHSTLHKLLMQRGKSEHSNAVATAQALNMAASGQQSPNLSHTVTATKSRPSPVRSPEARKTLDQMRNSLSAGTSGVSMLSRSAPSTSSMAAVSSGLNASANAAGGEPSRNVWARGEPRPHINSVCSVGEASSIADEVNDVLSGLSPSGTANLVDLQDIASDDEEEGAAGGYLDKDSSDDDSDIEGTSPSLAKLSTSTGSRHSSKKGGGGERVFWQYNVQAKGPKGQKIVIETKMEDPHVLNEIVDPVFSGEGVALQGIKHSGKARRGDGNDLTPNPRKLAAIGKELDQLSSVINGMTPVAEQPFGARCKSRKEKNKLASRACRLKKKAQHEANKVKCHGLLEEHRELSESIRQVKELLVKKMDINCTIPQPDLTANIDVKVNEALNKVVVAGNTTKYVNDKINEHLPYV